MPASASRVSTPVSIRPFGRPRRKDTPVVSIESAPRWLSRIPPRGSAAPKTRRRPLGGPASIADLRLYTPPAIPRGPSDDGDAGDARTCAWIVIYPDGGGVSMLGASAAFHVRDRAVDHGALLVVRRL